jgi:putative addiction module CopG family antidote
MAVTLDTVSEKLIREKVASGRYQDEAEVIRAALQALEERERFEQLRAKVAAGYREAERGELVVYTPQLREEIIRSALCRSEQAGKPSS